MLGWSLRNTGCSPYSLLDTIAQKYTYIPFNNILGNGYICRYDITTLMGKFKYMKNNSQIYTTRDLVMKLRIIFDEGGSYGLRGISQTKPLR